MDLEQGLANLRNDISNSGVEDDTFATICYITIANQAIRLLESRPPDQRDADTANEFLMLCSRSGNDSLRYLVEGQCPVHFEV
jgi:hypothetical protein